MKWHDLDALLKQAIASMGQNARERMEELARLHPEPLPPKRKARKNAEAEIIEALKKAHALAKKLGPLWEAVALGAAYALAGAKGVRKGLALSCPKKKDRDAGLYPLLPLSGLAG